MAEIEIRALRKAFDGAEVRGIPFHIQRALSHQVAFDLETADHIPGSHELPDYSHVTVGAGQVVIHQCSFLYDGPLFSLQDRAAMEWIGR
jgi:3',5'-cyclic-AMP phosphodiesterase